jgi:hypothetical protein
MWFKSQDQPVALFTMSQDDLAKLIEIRNELFELIRRENRRSLHGSEQLNGGVSYLEFGALPSIEEVIECAKPQLEN